MKYNKGDIVIVKFPFLKTKGVKFQKGRPALVLSPYDVKRRYNDYTLAAITSKLPDEIMDLELIIKPSQKNGLVKKSLLRIDFIMTIPAELISRKIGVLSQKSLEEAENKLKILLSI